MTGRCEKCAPAATRRSFLRLSLGCGAGLAAASLPASLRAQQAAARQAAGGKAKSVIFLWMGGGPSQMDTFDPKPGHANAGPFKAVDTSVPGLRFSELLPRCAKNAHHLAVVRSLSTMEAAHERGVSLMHVGMRPVPGLEIPSTGTVVSYEKGREDFPLPHFIAIDPPLIPQSEVFGQEYLPFPLKNADDPIPNLKRRVEEARDRDRARLMLEQSRDWDARRPQPAVQQVEKAYVQSEEVMNTPLLKAFDYKSDPSAGRYKGRFGINCLLARRLAESGCSFIEVGFGGWDTHEKNFDTLEKKLPELDGAMGTLIEDLAERGSLKDTLVVWAGEFGRTPEINKTEGRDHWARGFSVVLAGGGIQGGRVYGDTGPDGMQVVKPVPVWNLFATIYAACGIDPDKKYETEGRKVKYASKDGQASTSATPLRDLLA